MRRLAVIPSDLLEEYEKKGHYEQWVRDYYNPNRFFDEVYVLSPHEKYNPSLYGMKVMHTPINQLKNRIKDLKIDIIRAYGGNWACRAACENKVPGVPVIVSVHDRRPERIYESIKNADIVFCVSPIVREVVLRKFKNPDRVWLLPDRVDMQQMKRVVGGNLILGLPFKYKILFVGRLSPEKNLDTLLRALKFLGKDFGVIAIGAGNKKIYEEILKEDGTLDQCRFIQRVPNNELAQYYSLCDCLCVPSRDEGFGLVMIEALACSTVVVTSNIRPMSEYIKDAENGLLVDEYENPQKLALVIQQACLNLSLREYLKNNARYSVEIFEKSKIDAQEVQLYERIFTMKNNDAFKMPFWKAIWSKGLSS